MDLLRAWVSRGLERGAPPGALGRIASATWARTARVDRLLRFPADARVVGVGGATLGGSGKTPLAIACAKVLRQAGARVALVGHAYRACPGRARFASPTDPLDVVGDEALECTVRLAHDGVPVVVGPDRQSAVDLALTVADVVVVDGLGQARPRRLALALLAVDAASPWGAGRCPPLGDLRAAEADLLAAADRVVEVGAGGRGPRFGNHRAEAVSRGAWLGDRLLGWDGLRGLRCGLVTSLARPSRLLSALEAKGIRPVSTVFGADHGRGFAAERRDRPALDLWLCTSKCALHLGHIWTSSRGAPLGVLDYTLRLDGSLASALVHLLRERPAA